MKPSNLDDIRKRSRIFGIYFAITVAFLFFCGSMSLITAKRGLGLIQKKKLEYDLVFQKQSEYGRNIDNLITELYDLYNSERSLAAHNHKQSMVSKERIKMMDEIKTAGIDKEYYQIFFQILTELEEIQNTVSESAGVKDKRTDVAFNLEQCREKYNKLTEQNSKK